jgi:hypothetical protein
MAHFGLALCTHSLELEGALFTKDRMFIIDILNLKSDIPGGGLGMTTDFVLVASAGPLKV